MFKYATKKIEKDRDDYIKERDNFPDSSLSLNIANWSIAVCNLKLALIDAVPKAIKQYFDNKQS